jgi:hypothetical protein
LDLAAIEPAYCYVEFLSDDAVLPEGGLLIAGHPAKDLRCVVKLLDEVVHLEIYRNVPVVASIVDGCPTDVGQAVKLVYGHDLDSAQAHVLGPDPSVPLETLLHRLLQGFAVVADTYSSRRRGNEGGCIGRHHLLDVDLAVERLSEQISIAHK